MTRQLITVLIILITSCGQSYQPDEKNLNEKKEIIVDSADSRKIKERESTTSGCERLIAPSKDFLSESEINPKAENEYFLKYYGARSEKEVIKNYEWGEPCQWRQVFKGGITYEHEECMETGSNVTITFKGYCKDEIVKFVGWFLTTRGNKWNNDFTEYGPIDDWAGCSANITEKEKDIFVLDYYCGC